MLAGSAIYPFLITTVRIAIYILWGALLFHFPLRAANWRASLSSWRLPCFLFRDWASCPPATCCSSSAAIRQNAADRFVGRGWRYALPRNLLPDWLQLVARLNPMTHALNAMRAALLGGAAFSELVRPLRFLLLFTLVFWPVSVRFFPGRSGEPK